jgi:hypothetical protein
LYRSSHEYTDEYYRRRRRRRRRTSRRRRRNGGADICGINVDYIDIIRIDIWER